MPKDNTDLSGQPHWSEVDLSVLPTVQPDLSGVRRAAVGFIGRVRGGVEMYATVGDVDQGGILVLGQAQVRHLYASLGELINQWDTEPRDLIAEADAILSEAGHVGRNRASKGYEIETDGTVVYIYYSQGRERTNGMEWARGPLHVLEEAGYTGPNGATAPKPEASTDKHAARIVAIPPAAESF